MKAELYPSPCLEDEQALENCFLTKSAEYVQIPDWETAKSLLPQPIWEGHGDSIQAYEHAWKLAFKNLYNPAPENGFVSPYIDAAFNGDLFLWDSCFMLMFGRYADTLFPFRKTLDNFYAAQLPDGFIPRQLHERDGMSKWMRFDPVSTGPNLLAWCEWEYFLHTGDMERMRRVYAPICAYHRWLKRYHTWPDGSYWSTGWGSGMDNQPRLPKDDRMDRHQQERCHHGWMSWIDTNFQQVLSCNMLLNMMDALGLDADRAEIAAERDALVKLINDTMWSEDAGFYFDRYRDGSLAAAKTIGAYWGLLAGAVPLERKLHLIRRLTDENIFARPHPIPSLSRDSAGYAADGGYWCGGVWAPTNYMVLRGLRHAGEHALAAAIARRHYDRVLQVWQSTGTFWENYAPEEARPGHPAKPDFVGWTGLTPIAILIEYVLGIQMDVPGGVIHWYITNPERHGIEKLRFGDRSVSLVCEKRKTTNEKPVIRTKNCEGIRIIPHVIDLPGITEQTKALLSGNPVSGDILGARF